MFSYYDSKNQFKFLQITNNEANISQKSRNYMIQRVPNQIFIQYKLSILANNYFPNLKKYITPLLGYSQEELSDTIFDASLSFYQILKKIKTDYKPILTILDTKPDSQEI